MGLPYAEVIGDPVAHSKSPLIHKFWLEKLGIPGDYRATRVTAGELPAYIEARRADPDWRGCNVTMPLKAIAMGEIDDVVPNCRKVGATNCLGWLDGRLWAMNHDSTAVVCALPPINGQGTPCVVIGAGGAARAAVYALDLLRAEITVMCRDSEKGVALQSLSERPIGVVGMHHQPSADYLINATPLGMPGRPRHEVDLSAMPENGLVFDMVYEPPQTELLEQARMRGLKTENGIRMLCEQAASSFLSFFGVCPEDELVDEAVRLAG